MNILVFGASSGGKRYYNYIKKKNEDITILAFIDNNPEIIGSTVHGIPIKSPKEIREFKFEKIVIATTYKYSIEIYNQLRNMGISEKEIEQISHYSDVWGYDEDSDNRVNWLKDFSNYVYKNNISGSVAECGVSRGHFARYINKYFYDRKLYLFDTFDGFTNQDMEAELSLGNDVFNNSVFAQDKDMFRNTDSECVVQWMPYPDKCIVKEGVFPETAIGVTDSFAFVNLDMDLYRPMLAALNFFWEKMNRGGIILCHDYYTPALPGVALAISDFEKSIQKHIPKTPIGDFISIALIKD